MHREYYKAANWRSPGTKYKRSKMAFAVTSTALTLAPLGSWNHTVTPALELF